MGIRDRWRELFGERQGELMPARRLDLASGFNVRELGGYAVPGGETRWRRYIRSGSLDMLSFADQQRLHAYGVRLIVDLRGDIEVQMARDKITEMRDVRFLHVPLHDINLSDPALALVDDGGGYLARGYLTMLANRAAMGRIFSFFASAEDNECILFHCAAGMDRTGVVAMLTLGLAGATDERICADYCYSFGTEAEVDRMVFGGDDTVRPEMRSRYETVLATLSWLHTHFGTVEDYLGTCGITNTELDRLKARILR